MRIERWLETHPGKSQVDLAQETGLSTSMVSQAKTKSSGVSSRSHDKFAKAFGMTGDELTAKAYEWWLTQGQPASDAMRNNPAVKAAVEYVQSLIAGAHDGLIETILVGYSGPFFADRPQEWWEKTLMEELQNIRKRDVKAEAASKVARHGRKAIREAKEIAEATRNRTSDPPPHRMKKHA